MFDKSDGKVSAKIRSLLPSYCPVGECRFGVAQIWKKGGEGKLKN